MHIGEQRIVGDMAVVRQRDGSVINGAPSLDVEP